MNDLFNAWSFWINGKLDENFVLWGYEIYIWNRIGTVSQFIGALMIVFEIMGDRRINIFGDKFHSLLRYFKNLLDKEEEEISKNKNSFANIGCLNLIFFLPIFLLSLIISLGILESIGFVDFIRTFKKPFAMIMGLPITMILTFILCLLISFIFALIFIVIISTLKSRTPHILFKICSILLVIFGFHFNLLAS